MGCVLSPCVRLCMLYHGLILVVEHVSFRALGKSGRLPVDLLVNKATVALVLLKITLIDNCSAHVHRSFHYAHI